MATPDVGTPLCMLCGQLMVVVCSDEHRSDLCFACRADEPAHFHLRCENCSPAGWFAVMRITVRPEETPPTAAA